MQEKDCEFSYGGYEFADAEGKPIGKRVEVPLTINYKQALKNTIISTPSVMFDMTKLTKKDIEMPNLKRGQDAATWWQVLKKIDKAYGINEVLFYYRRDASSLSANKFKALKRTWYLYRKIEKFNVVKSFYYFCFYVFNAIKKRT